MSTPDAGPLEAVFDSQRFRYVMGHYPTGVSVVTAIDAEGKPTGMAVGSFTSVSLDPPLVAFLPDKSSTTFPKIRESSSFCVNVLGADQESVCRALAVKGGDKFRDVPWHPAASGSPIIDGTVAWVDCDIESITEAGDHYIVLGRVRDLDVHNSSLPLLFFQGGYGRFNQLSRTAFAEFDLISQLRLVDVARDHMQRLADELRVEVLAASLVGEEIVIVGSAGKPRSRPVPTRLGQRIPLIPPVGAAFVAWAHPEAVKAWLDRAADHSEAARAVHEASLERVRQRGWSLALDHPHIRQLESTLFHSTPDSEPGPAALDLLARLDDAYEPEELPNDEELRPNNIIAPVFAADGSVALGLALRGLPELMTGAEIQGFAARLLEVTAAVGQSLKA